ncbi:hypothetical protein [Bradyrhizobium sp. McL0615]|uniref:hypothetical protein n=1 Tax=Bradyrhizobium sp. McL0615 TaxID=3415673 RepID=UPI003CF16FC3
MSATEPAPPVSLRPVTWPIWLAWVLVSALTPVFSTISATAFGKQISLNAEHPALINIGILGVIAFAVLAPPIMQGLVLKRVLLKLSVVFCFFCILLSGILWFVLMSGRHGQGPALIEAGFQTQFQLQRVALPQRLAGTLNAARMLDLPWGPFLLWTITTSALTSLIPAWALGFTSGLRRATLLFLAASVVGACVSGIAEQLYQMTIDHHPLNDWGLNGQSWTQRFHALAVRAGVGAVWGATTAIFVVAMTRRLAETSTPQARLFAPHRAGGLALLLIAPLQIAVLAPFVGHLAGPRGVVAGAPELRRALSLAPSRDSSQGETVLAYSHDVAIPVARMAASVIAPDGRSAIVRTVDHTLVQVDLATGHALRQLAGALAPLERYAIVWSPDGRYLALRSDGAEVPIPNTHYMRHQSRVRLYALPVMTLAGEFSNSEDTCFDVYAREPMLFSNDSKSLWLVCSQHYEPKPDDPMAIRLDVPTMQALDIRRHGEGAESGETRGLERIGDSVWSWQFPYGGKPFRIRDLTHDREIVTVSMPMDLIGKLTAQRDQSQMDEKAIRLKFCGVLPGAPSDTDPAYWICRTLSFETRTGALIGSADEGDRRSPDPATSLPRSVLTGHGLRVEAFWREDTKTGEIVVRDSATGRERQRIVSIAQRPVQVSADGVWLMTVAVHGGALRLYRIHL